MRGKRSTSDIVAQVRTLRKLYPYNGTSHDLLSVSRNQNPPIAVRTEAAPEGGATEIARQSKSIFSFLSFSSRELRLRSHVSINDNPVFVACGEGEKFRVLYAPDCLFPVPQ